MVLIDTPYFNEPGYQCQEGTPQGKRKSDAYNEQVRIDTLKHAILAPLGKPLGKPHAVFADVLALHWRHKRDAIKRFIHAGSAAVKAVGAQIIPLLDAV